MSILILSAQIHDHLLMLGPNVLQALGTHGFKAIPIKPPWPLLGDCSSAWVGQIHVKHTESACPCRNKFLQNSGILQPLQPFNGWLCRTKSCHAKKKKNIQDSLGPCEPLGSQATLCRWWCRALFVRLLAKSKAIQNDSLIEIHCISNCK